MKAYHVNEFLTLKLEGVKTYLYLNNKRFFQCRFLGLQIPSSEGPSCEINYFEQNIGTIGPKEASKKASDFRSDFLGYCSTFQAWNESGYEPRFLNIYTSFDLLEVLIKQGDPVAKRMFREEIFRCFEGGYRTSIGIIVGDGSFDCLSFEDRIDLMVQYFPLLLKVMIEAEYWTRIQMYLVLVRESFLTGLIEPNYSTFFDVVDSFKGLDTYLTFAQLIIVSEKTALITHRARIKTKFDILLEEFEMLPERERFLGFQQLTEVAKFTGLREKYLPLFLKMIMKYFKKEKYKAIYELIDRPEGSEFIELMHLVEKL